MTRPRFDNPFHDLWVTESLDPTAFTRVFSPVLVTDAEALFSTSNVVLKGRQGSGKSMLLNLLDTGTRIAYAKSGTTYPVPTRQCRFISAGVNLTRENASQVAARAAEVDESRRFSFVASTFADYLNCLLCVDILRNAQLLAEFQRTSQGLLPEILVNFGREVELTFVAALRKTESWSGWLGEDTQTLKEVIRDIDSRLRAHRDFANYNVMQFPARLLSSRSAAGLPVADLAAVLRKSGAIPYDALVLLCIDQHEELFELERSSGLGNVFRQVINAALARRDPRVAYRIGTRHYAWDEDVTVWGSGASLEEMREYSVINLDFILGRGEHTKNWKFPLFAEDVVARRLHESGYSHSGSGIRSMFGTSMRPREKAIYYVRDHSSLIRAEANWSSAWQAHLDAIWRAGEPLDAYLGAAWLRQEAQRKKRIPQDSSTASGRPWEKSVWWRKERNEIALMQIAGARQQALVWSGERQVIELAGHNILALMTICRSVWATWQRRNPEEADRAGTLPSFSIEDQAIGVGEASQLWLKKIRVGHSADDRFRFISALGVWFRQRLMNDRALSNPGYSGFSLIATDMLANNRIVRIIKTCRDHGDLLESPHTTKLKDHIPRRKWYLHPLLCPYFRLPHIRTKEPIYTSLNELHGLLAAQPSASLAKAHTDGPASNEQFDLFGN